MDEAYNELNDSGPPAERSRRLRKMAADALERASASEDQLKRAGFINLATKWHAMALELERASSEEPDRRQP